MFFIIGIGLADEKDVTVRGMEAIKSSSRVYLEHYTSLLMVDSSRLVFSTTPSDSSLSSHFQESFYQKSILIADREMAENNSDDMMRGADVENVSFLVVGDPFG